VGNLLRYIQLKAFGRAFRGYHTAWLVVGAAAWMINRAQSREDVVFRTLLKPGERLVVTTFRPGSAPPPGD
jgi:hypothetical protein